MKKIIAAVLVVFSCLLLTGCSQADYMIIQKPDGSLQQTVSIEVDMDALNEAGITEKTDIDNLKASLYAEIKVQYDAALVNYIISVRTSKELSEDQKLKYEQGVTSYFGWDKDTLVLTTVFATGEIYREFQKHQLVTETSVESREPSTFITKTIKEVTTVFGQFYNETDLEPITLGMYYYTKYKNYIVNNFGEEIFSKLPDPKVTYTYVTPYSRVHSNADETFLSDVGHVHMWTFDLKTTDGKIILYRYSANSFYWYLVALAATAVFVACYLAVVYFKLNKSLKKLSGQ